MEGMARLWRRANAFYEHWQLLREQALQAAGTAQVEWMLSVPRSRIFSVASGSTNEQEYPGGYTWAGEPWTPAGFVDNTCTRRYRNMHGLPSVTNNHEQLFALVSVLAANASDNERQFRRCAFSSHALAAFAP